MLSEILLNHKGLPMRINGLSLEDFEAILCDLFMGQPQHSAMTHWLSGVDVFEAARLIVEGV